MHALCSHNHMCRRNDVDTKWWWRPHSQRKRIALCVPNLWHILLDVVVVTHVRAFNAHKTYNECACIIYIIVSRKSRTNANHIQNYAQRARNKTLASCIASCIERCVCIILLCLSQSPIYHFNMLPRWVACISRALAPAHLLECTLRVMPWCRCHRMQCERAPFAKNMICMPPLNRQCGGRLARVSGQMHKHKPGACICDIICIWSIWICRFGGSDGSLAHWYNILTWHSQT